MGATGEGSVLSSMAVAASKRAVGIGDVFVALPFEKSDEVCAVEAQIEAVCTSLKFRIDNLFKKQSEGLVPTEEGSQGIVLLDLHARISRAEAVIIVLTYLNPNVLYELGFALATHDFENVVLICADREKLDKELPFDLKPLAIKWYNDASGTELFNRLSEALQRVKANRTKSQFIITGPENRTKQVNEDLKELRRRRKCLGHRTEGIYQTCLLSALAVDDYEPFPKEQKSLQDLLIEEKKLLIELAIDGCEIRFIIAPRGPDSRRLEETKYILHRLRCLRSFLESENPRLFRHMDWVCTAHPRNNVLIVGTVSYLEGIRWGSNRASEFTVRLTDRAAITSHIYAQEEHFNQLAREMSPKTVDLYSEEARTHRRKQITEMLKDLIETSDRIVAGGTSGIS